MAFMSQGKFWQHNVAVDLGTATTRVAIGAHRLLEESSAVAAKRALSAGVVVDAETAVTLLRPLLAQARMFGIVKPCVLACAPSDVTGDERRLLVESITDAGASAVVVIPEPLAAMVGGGVEVSSPYAQMIIDIGEGVTDCAITQSSRIQETCSIRLGCASMRQAIRSAFRKQNTIVSDEEAEAHLRSCGVAQAGSDILSGTAGRVAAAVETVAAKILETIDSFLRALPPTLGCEVIESGIWLSGGGALLPGVRGRIEGITGISVRCVANPRTAVVEGARAILPVVSALNQWR